MLPYFCFNLWILDSRTQDTFSHGPWPLRYLFQYTVHWHSFFMFLLGYFSFSVPYIGVLPIQIYCFKHISVVDGFFIVRILNFTLFEYTNFYNLLHTFKYYLRFSVSQETESLENVNIQSKWIFYQVDKVLLNLTY